MTGLSITYSLPVVVVEEEEAEEEEEETEEEEREFVFRTLIRVWGLGFRV